MGLSSLSYLLEKHYDFQRREKRDPRRNYDENDAIFMMTGIDPSAKPEKKKSRRARKKKKGGKVKPKK